MKIIFLSLCICKSEIFVATFVSHRIHTVSTNLRSLQYLPKPSQVQIPVRNSIQPLRSRNSLKEPGTCTTGEKFVVPGRIRISGSIHINEKIKTSGYSLVHPPAGSAFCELPGILGPICTTRTDYKLFRFSQELGPGGTKLGD